MGIGITIKTILNTGWNVGVIAKPTYNVIPNFDTVRKVRNLYITDTEDATIDDGSSDNSMQIFKVPFFITIYEDTQANAEKTASEVKRILLLDSTANALYSFGKIKVERDIKICKILMDGYQLMIKGANEV